MFTTLNYPFDGKEQIQVAKISDNKFLIKAEDIAPEVDPKYFIDKSDLENGIIDFLTPHRSEAAGEIYRVVEGKESMEILSEGTWMCPFLAFKFVQEYKDLAFEVWFFQQLQKLYTLDYAYPNQRSRFHYTEMGVA